MCISKRNGRSSRSYPIRKTSAVRRRGGVRSHPRTVILVNYYVGAFADGAVGCLVVVFADK